MTDRQAQYLHELTHEYPKSEWDITTIEYPAGLTKYSGTSAERVILDAVKIVYVFKSDPDRMYIDYVGADGWPEHTESRERVKA